jgi:hypothetical protein
MCVFVVLYGEARLAGELGWIYDFWSQVKQTNTFFFYKERNYGSCMFGLQLFFFFLFYVKKLCCSLVLLLRNNNFTKSMNKLLVLLY